jgi:hypothetical protein
VIPEDVLVWWQRTVGEKLDESARTAFMSRPDVRRLAADFSLNTLRETAAAIHAKTGRLDPADWLLAARAVHRNTQPDRHGRDQPVTGPDGRLHQQHSRLLNERPDYP